MFRSFFMRKFIKLEKISTNCKRIQKKWNKKWLTRGIFTCVVAIALIGSCRYISEIVKVSSNVNGKELPIYCVQTDEKKVALSFEMCIRDRGYTLLHSDFLLLSRDS